MHEIRSSRRRVSTGAGTIALSLGLCLCAGQLIGPSPANAAASIATASIATASIATASIATTVAVAPVTPKVTESVNHNSIPWGSAVKVTAKFVDPTTGQVVTKGLVRLQALIGGKWRSVRANSVGKNGQVTFSDSPRRSTFYRAQFAGAPGYRATVGRSIKVSVRASGAEVLSEARSHNGAPYRFAAAGPSSFDCSGYTMYVYRKTVGTQLPHDANSQQSYGAGISKGDMRAGDLIVFRNGSYGYHAAIYAGGGYMYDSPHTGASVGRHKMYGSNYVVRRLAA